MKNILTIVIVMFCALFIVVPSICQAGVVDNFIAQSVVTPEGRYSGQSRNYFTGGSMNLRFQADTQDHPFSVTPPSLTIGCNGIDLSFGSFSYLNVDYLVNKLKMIIASAPVFFFQIALEAISHSVSNQIAKIEATLNAFNALQLNRCSASKIVATIPFDAMKDGGSWGSAAANAVGNLNTSTGAQNFWNDATAAYQSFGGTPASAGTITTMTSQCSVEVQTIIGTSSLISNTNTVLGNVAQQYGFAANDPFINMIRGIVGDSGVVLNPSTNLYNTPFIPPCPYNEHIDLASIMTGTNIWARDILSNCAIASSTQTLQTYVDSMIQSIVGKMRTANTFLSPQEIQFVEMSPVPVIPLLKQTAISGTPGVMNSDMFETIVGEGMALKMMEEMMRVTTVLGRYVKTAQSIDSHNSGCNISFVEGAFEYMPGITKRMEGLYRDLDAEYKDDVKNVVATMQIADEFDNMVNKMQQQMAQNVINSTAAKK